MLTTPDQDQDSAVALMDNPKPRLTLRDAVRLCGMSEKTLRRKLEAGLLSGVRENLDYGGFMWMIDARSLSELYPDSAQLRDYIRLLEVQMSSSSSPAEPAPSATAVPPAAVEARPEVRYTESVRINPTSNAAPTTPPPSTPPPPAGVTENAEGAVDESSASRATRHGNDFVIYLLEENRCLKEDLREKEIRLRQLQDRSLMLERECGEQRGTAATQARVLEWFQRQPQATSEGPKALPGATEALESPGTGGGYLVEPPQQRLRPALIGALSATLIIYVILAVLRML